MSKRRPQGDGLIRKRDDGRWEGRIIIGHKSDGRPIFKSVFGKTQKQALENLHKAIEAYRGVDLCEESRMTLSEWLDRWLDRYMLFTVRESTLRSYRRMCNSYVKRYIGSKPLTSLTTADIQKFYNKLRKEGRAHYHPVHGCTLSDSTIRSVHMMLHEALDTAVQENLLVKNPTNGTTIPKKNYAERQVLNDSQLKIFLEAARQEPYWYDLFYVEVMTGLRLGEICGLQWSDLDFSTNTLTVARSVSDKYGMHIGETKTAAGSRKIILPPSAAELLKARKADAGSEWVFPYYKNPSEPLHPGTAARKLRQIVQKAGLPSISFHSLRHTFSTHAIQGGVDAKTLAGILGHTNASFTLDTYTHVTGDARCSVSFI